MRWASVRVKAVLSSFSTSNSRRARADRAGMLNRKMPAVALLFCSSLGCFSYGDVCESCPSTRPCPGACVPYVGGGWMPVLVSSSPAHTPPPCPSVAPYESMTSSSPPLTACGVQATDGVCDDGLECVPAVPEWISCIVRDGAHPCPTGYTAVAVDMPDESLCCPTNT